MIVEEILYSDKLNLIKLKVSNEDFYISYDFYNDLDLSKDDELDFETFKLIVNEDGYNRCKNFALKQISYSSKTSFEIRKKLRDKGFSDENIEKTIDFLKEYALVDDQAYVKSYVNDKSNISLRSKNKIFYKLKAKSIPEVTIEKYLANISDQEEYQKAKKLGSRKAKNDKSFENKQKVYRFLAGRGFSFDIISKVVDDLFK
jgi:regulatory protein